MPSLPWPSFIGTRPADLLIDELEEMIRTEPKVFVKILPKDSELSSQSTKARRNLSTELVYHHDLHQKYWGLADRQPEPPATWEMPGNAKLYTLPSYIVFFKEYLRLFKYIDIKRTHDFLTMRTGFRTQSHSGVFIIGMPGIGKSMFLWLYLMISLALQLPIVIFWESHLFLHTKSGAYRVTCDIKDFVYREALKGLAFLINMDWIGEIPAGLDVTGLMFVIAATSSQPHQYKKWSKNASMATLIINPPTEEELRDYFCRELPQQSDMTFEAAFGLAGPNIHTLTELQYGMITEVQVIRDIRLGFSNLHDNDLDNLLFSSSTPDLKLLSHSLISINRSETGMRTERGQDAMVHQVPKTVLRLLHTHLAQRQLGYLHRMYKLFAGSSQLSVPRAWCFETLCHRLFATSSPNTVVKLFSMAVAGAELEPKFSPQSLEWPMAQRSMQTFVASETPKHTSNIDCYYIPIEANNPTFDSMVHLSNPSRLVGLQMTMSATHSLNQSGLERLRERRLPDEELWLVYVIPEGQTISVPYTDTSPFNQFKYFCCPVDVGNVSQELDG
ncbi:hypothetical protein MIND_00677800 [Mycena indigotica]|uniref:Uncharacterized protein n=1 Tax=Mycena indigotica TaxID=2126181 RepID=A0A8H6W6J1_9AGAR|nr:uncharacterized protein MIND_00677800 [Mycena indigotica]KAF7301134.1 hypothetical protein MIND_00677800 [Mycena indigotica]